MSDQYLILLSSVLMGYAIVGKSFAYLPFPPVFIGEIALVTGIVVLLRTGCLIAALTTLASLLLAATMVWVLLRTLPFVGEYGVDALRDSVVIMYGIFAFIVIALLVEDGRRVNTIIRYYGVFLNIFIPAIAFVLVVNHYLPHGLLSSVFDVRVGEAAVHLAGAAVFALVGFRKMTPLWIILVVVIGSMVSVWSRGGMLAVIFPITFAMLMLGKLRELTAALVTGLVIFSAMYAVEGGFTDYHEAQSTEERSFSARQIIENIASIVGEAGERSEGTKTWRIDWWNTIIGNTVFGPNFWTGRGFGLNLADADGFQDRRDPDSPPLRSPHNAHMTMLARAGVPGLALWVGFLASWFGMVMHAMWTARRRVQTAWAGLFLFISCYVMSNVINASFDVALEGPMLGIWFWCLIGFGIGSVMVYRYCTKPPTKIIPSCFGHTS